MRLIFLFLSLLIFSAVGFGQISSVYTSTTTKSCKTVESSEEGAGWYVGACKGTGGFTVQLTEGDLRQSLNIVSPKKKKFELNFSQVASGFSAIGEKLEWRVKKGVPFAMIARFNVSDPEDSAKTTSYLVVSKISAKESCIVDVVEPQKNQNEEARKSADSAATKPCKEF